MKIFTINFKRIGGSDSCINQNGYLLLDNGWMWLKDASEVTIRKGTIDETYQRKVLDACSKCVPLMNCCGYIVSNLKLIQCDANVIADSSQLLNQPPQSTKSILPKERLPAALTFSASSITHSSNNSKPFTKVVIDKLFSQVLRPHQKQAAEFLINRLMGYAVNESKINMNCRTTSNSDSNNNSSSRNNSSSKTSNTNSYVDPSLMTGAILADDMGTGKTLIALSVIWSICRQKFYKCVVICPTSLVRNWQTEVKKWLGTHHSRNFLFVSGSSGSSKSSGADATVHQFIKADSTIHSTLIICYDLFRNYSDALNTISSLELLICDEGHRIKNHEGTKTSIALTNCCATRRVVMTGTPIQNNLDELYTIVNFTIPFYLGTLHQFQTKYSAPIIKANQLNATKEDKIHGKLMNNKLKQLLQPILIRRTAASVLSSVLPVRSEYVVFLPLSPSQWNEYYMHSNSILKQFNLSSSFSSSLVVGMPLCSTGTGPAQSSSSSSSLLLLPSDKGMAAGSQLQPYNGAINRTMQLENHEPNTMQTATATTTAHCSRRSSNSNSSGSNSGSGGNDELNSEAPTSGLPSGVLPALLSLRQICNVSSYVDTTHNSSATSATVTATTTTTDKPTIATSSSDNTHTSSISSGTHNISSGIGDSTGSSGSGGSHTHTPSSSGGSSSRDDAMSALLSSSTKLQWLTALLLTIKALPPSSVTANTNTTTVTANTNGANTATNTTYTTAANNNNNNNNTIQATIHTDVTTTATTNTTISKAVTATAATSATTSGGGGGGGGSSNSSSRHVSISNSGNNNSCTNHDRVVIVSNFMTMLDMVECVCKHHKWLCLRIDGSVDSDKRMKMVQHFNDTNSPFYIMLLSTRAGGVGLNLIGANHLIVCEPDWNPSTDLQAMGRVYRHGQQKPVSVYRLICKDTIDEGIMKRQQFKDALSEVIPHYTVTTATTTSSGGVKSSGSSCNSKSNGTINASSSGSSKRNSSSSSNTNSGSSSKRNSSSSSNTNSGSSSSNNTSVNSSNSNSKSNGITNVSVVAVNATTDADTVASYGNNNNDDDDCGDSDECEVESEDGFTGVPLVPSRSDSFTGTGTAVTESEPAHSSTSIASSAVIQQQQRNNKRMKLVNDFIPSVVAAVSSDSAGTHNASPASTTTTTTTVAAAAAAAAVEIKVQNPKTAKLTISSLIALLGQKYTQSPYDCCLHDDDDDDDECIGILQEQKMKEQTLKVNNFKRHYDYQKDEDSDDDTRLVSVKHTPQPASDDDNDNFIFKKMRETNSLISFQIRLQS